MEITSPPKTITVRDLDFMFAGGVPYGLTLMPEDVIERLDGWVVTVAKTGEVLTILPTHLLYMSIRTRELEVARKAPHAVSTRPETPA